MRVLVRKLRHSQDRLHSRANGVLVSSHNHRELQAVGGEHEDANEASQPRLTTQESVGTKALLFKLSSLPLPRNFDFAVNEQDHVLAGNNPFEHEVGLVLASANHK